MSIEPKENHDKIYHPLWYKLRGICNELSTERINNLLSLTPEALANQPEFSNYDRHSTIEFFKLNNLRYSTRIDFSFIGDRWWATKEAILDAGALELLAECCNYSSKDICIKMGHFFPNLLDSKYNLETFIYKHRSAIHDLKNDCSAYKFFPKYNKPYNQTLLHATQNVDRQPISEKIMNEKNLVHKTIETTKQDLNKASYRVVATQIIKTAKAPLVSALTTGQRKATTKLIGEFFDTPPGNAIISMMISLGLDNLPIDTMQEQRAKLAEEMRIAAYSDAGNFAADILLNPLREALSEAVTSAPEIPTLEIEPHALPEKSTVSAEKTNKKKEKVCR